MSLGLSGLHRGGMIAPFAARDAALPRAPAGVPSMTVISRRRFARLLALSGSAALLPDVAFGSASGEYGELDLSTAPLPPTPAQPDETYWRAVRAKFLVPRDVGF